MKRFPRLERLFLLAAVLFSLTALVLALGWYWAEGQGRAKEKAVAARSRQVATLSRDLDPEPLKKRLEEVRQGLAQVPFPSQDAGPALDGLLVQSAQRVELQRVTVQPEGKQKLGDREYPILRRQVAASGELSPLLVLLRQVQGAPYPTLFLDQVSLVRKERDWAGTFDIVLLLRRE